MRTSNNFKWENFFQNFFTKYKIRVKKRPDMLVGFVETENVYIFFEKTIYIYYFAGYPVSGKIIGRKSGEISIRYNLAFFCLGFQMFKKYS